MGAGGGGVVSSRCEEGKMTDWLDLFVDKIEILQRGKFCII